MEFAPPGDCRRYQSSDPAANKPLLQGALANVRHFARARYNRQDIHDDDLAQSAYDLGVRLIPITHLGMLVLGTPPNKRPAKSIVFGPEPGSRTVSDERRTQMNERRAAVAYKPHPLNLQTRKANAHTSYTKKADGTLVVHGIMLPGENDVTVRLRMGHIVNDSTGESTENMKYRMDRFRSAPEQQPDQDDVRFDCASSVACVVSPRGAQVSIEGVPNIKTTTDAHNAVMKTAVATMNQLQSVLATYK